MKEFVSFRTDCQSMYFISTGFLKYKIGVVCVPQFQLSYIYNTTHSSHENFVKKKLINGYKGLLKKMGFSLKIIIKVSFGSENS